MFCDRPRRAKSVCFGGVSVCLVGRKRVGRCAWWNYCTVDKQLLLQSFMVAPEQCRMCEWYCDGCAVDSSEGRAWQQFAKAKAG